MRILTQKIIDGVNLRSFTILAICITLLISMAAKATERTVVRIGVLAFRSPEQTMKRWEPTVDSLTKAIPDHDFIILPMKYPEINPAVENKTIDFVLTNTGHYVELEANQGINRMVTLVKTIDGISTKVFGGVIFTRADRADINSIADLKEKDFLAVKRSSLGGFLVAWEQFLTYNIDPFSGFSSLSFNGLPQDDIVFKVLNGEADAGTVRTSVLEQMAKEGRIKLEDFKIINPQQTKGFPFIHSTKLYPEWPFSRLSHVDDELVEKITLALLNIKNDKQAPGTSNFDRWVLPLNYQTVHDLFTRLNTGPYQNFKTFTIQDVIEKYLYELLIGLIILSMTLIFITKIIHLNRSLQKALSDVKTLQGFIPICSSCKKIRDDKGYWNQVESYINTHSGAKFSHGYCPHCYEKEMGRIEGWKSR